MNQHVHTGFVQLTVTAIYVIVFLHIMRFAAAKLADTTTFGGFGKALGGVVSF